LITVDRVRIEGFRSIKSCDLELTSLNAIIGANGAGKSNLIAAFRFLNEILAERLQLYVGEKGGTDRLLHHGQKNTPALSMYFKMDRNAYEFELKPAQGGGLFFDHEDTVFYGDRVAINKYTIGRGNEETKLAVSVKNQHSVSQYVEARVKGWSLFHFHDASDSAPPKQHCSIDDNYELRADGANLPAVLFLMKEKYPTNYNRIVSHVQSVAPFFEDFDLKPSRLNESLIKIEWKQKGSDAYFDGFSLSDGTLRFICLATLLLQPLAPKVILLDEPELGLHPAALDVLVDMLKSASELHQIILATQSVHLLSRLSIDDIIVAEHDGSATNFKRPDKKELAEFLDEYSLGELWLKNLLGGRP
jgi:predicted ATPase